MSSTTEVLMPLMGEGITEATLVRWLKSPGDAIRKEEPLLEVSTDKVDTEIPAPAAGVLLATFASEGEIVAINSIIAHIGEPGAAVAPAPSQGKKEAATNGAENAQKAASMPQNLGASIAPARGLRSSPLVRKMAQSSGTDLNRVLGTGLGGRITRRDLEAFLAGKPTAIKAQEPALSASSQGAPATRPKGGAAHLEYGRLETKTVDGKELLEGVVVRREKMSRIRALTAEHMVRSVRTSPHVTTVFEIDMHQVSMVRERVKDKFRAEHGFNLTFTAFFLHAAVQAIKQHPAVNCSVDGEDILWKDSINLGVAVAIESGLIVPVIRNAGDLNLTGIARRLHDLATRARSKKLSPEDVQGGTFSVTNPGMFGSLVSAPIINQPQVAILSIGAIIKRPVVIHDMIAIRPLVQIGLTFDHRVVDGEGGARFLATMKDLLESYRDTAL